MKQFWPKTISHLAKTSILFFLFISCSHNSDEHIKSNSLQKVEDLNISGNFQTRLKSIARYYINMSSKKMELSGKGIIEYSNGHDIIECYDSEYYKYEFRDSLLIHRTRNFSGNKSKYSYIYDQFGDIIKQTHKYNEEPIEHSHFSYIDRNLISENYSDNRNVRYVYDSIPNKIFKFLPPSSRHGNIDYTLNSNGQIILKNVRLKNEEKPYLEYKVEYVTDTIRKITKRYLKETIYENEDKPFIVTTFDYNTAGLLHKILIDNNEGPFRFTETKIYSYDENNNLLEVLVKKERSKSKEYSKSVYGGYTLMENFLLFPKEFLEFNIPSKTKIPVKYYLDEYYSELPIASNKKKIVLDSYYCPSHFTTFDSDDGVNWKPFLREEYNFEKVKQ